MYFDLVINLYDQGELFITHHIIGDDFLSYLDGWDFHISTRSGKFFCVVGLNVSLFFSKNVTEQKNTKKNIK